MRDLQRRLKKESYKLINMKGKYNNMSFKNILGDFLDFDNTYKTFMLLSFSGSKLMTGVWGGGGYTLVDSFRPRRYSERKAYKCLLA